MTTVAWDGHTMAADSQSDIGGYRRLGAVKIHRLPDGSLVGFSGRTDLCVLMLEWMQGGLRPDERPDAQKEAGEDCVNALQAMPDGTVRLHAQYGWSEIGAGPFAIGSGAHFAIAAMFMQATAPHAVWVATQLDTDSGGDVQSMMLHEPEAVPKEEGS